MKTRNYFPSNLKALRVGAGLTQVVVAAVVFRQYCAISEWERGKSQPSIEQLLSLCDLFGVTPGELLSEDLRQRAVHAAA